MSRNYGSPYAKPGMQYPSQSEDYLSLEIGGPGKSSTPARPTNNNGNNSGQSGGNYYQNKQRGRGDTYNRLYGGFSGRKNRNNFGERCYQQPQQGQRQQQPHQPNSGRWNNAGCIVQRQWRGAGQHRQQQNKQAFNRSKDIRAFVHPSMLEDPWRELMARHNAIKRSRLILQTPPAEKNTEEATSDSDTDTETLCPE